MYRIGVPPPLSAEAELQEGELVRHIVMGRAIHFDQVSQDCPTAAFAGRTRFRRIPFLPARWTTT
jgi:hypothetical protein